MAKFKFKLDSVEKVRLQTEQKKLEELSLCQRTYQEKIAYKKGIIEKKQKAFLSKSDLISKEAQINDIKLSEDYITGLNQQIIRADQAIIRSRRFLDQAMRQYILARRERMMIDRLKEKALEEFKLTEARLEQKNLDDLITMRSRLNSALLDSEEEIA